MSGRFLWVGLPQTFSETETSGPDTLGVIKTHPKRKWSRRGSSVGEMAGKGGCVRVVYELGPE